ncbi:hypothetical protein [Candidatus Azobacteroides pseudotrichonymphae]|uniref:hypothetical protein n=1 Tax=Candidatus Azobacteroides pseudotrichonymphae TaxID=511435 RepID=UPI0005A1A378|nr:hypothetical protein [Candidatus Azobacteroides pseudotrichonymphae]
MKGLIDAMRWVYFRMALILSFVLATIGTYYIFIILKKNYSGNQQDIYLTRIILIVVTSYSFYTLYYDALLLGKGLVNAINKIAIIS